MHKHLSRLTLLRPVDGVPELEAVWELLLEALELLPDQDVALALVGEEQGELGAVGGVAEHVSDQLEHRGDAGAT